MNRKTAHHHGDLRNALISAGLEILETDGLQALTLRACAARAGVSHAAPAHHFGRLPNLLSAIAAEGFRVLDEALRSAYASAEPDAETIVRNTADAYVGFAVEHPHLFRLMFASDRLDHENDALQQQSRAAYQALEMIAAHIASDRELAHDLNAARANELMLWSIVHGFANLQLEQQINVDGKPGAGSRVPRVSEVLPRFHYR